ncbi:hypothetical protein G3N30_11615 [Microbacterium lacticum]|uniref:hypothetical protein n=1 Tax=Microbacterium lacticum TaxID=33885 RepID=UPI0018B09359|nr:hypothetical protein [Microbacterium lacticum]MBF9336836.1 hypothetical protein [Microbacterium lacticum]
MDIIEFLLRHRVPTRIPASPLARLLTIGSAHELFPVITPLVAGCVKQSRCDLASQAEHLSTDPALLPFRVYSDVLDDVLIPGQ